MKVKLKFPTVKDAEKFAIQWSRKTGGGTGVSSSGEITIYNVDTKGKKFIEDYVENNFGKLKLKKVNKMAVKKTKRKSTKKSITKTTYASKLSTDAKKKLSSVRSALTRAGYKINIVKKSSGGSPVAYAGKVSKGNYRYKYKGKK